MCIIVGIDSARFNGMSYTDSVTLVESVMSLELLVWYLESKTKLIESE